LFQLGILPAVDVGKSVSRVGGAAQRAAYRAVAGSLKLAYSQFEELEAFAKFGTRLDDSTQRRLTTDGVFVLASSNPSLTRFHDRTDHCAFGFDRWTLRSLPSTK